MLEIGRVKKGLFPCPLKLPPYFITHMLDFFHPNKYKKVKKKKRNNIKNKEVY